jgi:hypothetical protein
LRASLTLAAARRVPTGTRMVAPDANVSAEANVVSRWASTEDEEEEQPK